jgi:serine/threonine-protein kinase
VARAFSADVAPGHVISATPSEGSTVQRGTAVRLTVSRGTQPVAVPDVTGKPVAEARGIREGKGLVVKQTEQASSEKPGTVIAQDPTGGSTTKPGGTVTLTVAKAEQVTVPDVTGASKSDAHTRLRAAGLKVKSVPQMVTDTTRKGTVVAQDPAAGTQVDKGSVVTIHIGRLPAASPTPSATPSQTASATP